MEAKWLQNGSLETSGRPLGADSASGGSPEPSQRGSGAARGSQKIRGARLGGLLGRKVDRFQGLGGVPRRVPEGLREAILEEFFAAGPCDTKKERKN